MMKRSFAAIAIISLFLTTSHAGKNPKLEVYAGLSPITGLNLGGGVNIVDRFSLEGVVGSSLYVSVAAAYLQYNIPIQGQTLKVGIGKATYTACGHGCGSDYGYDLRVRYNHLPAKNNFFGFYGEGGFYLGDGSLFGGDRTLLPHFSGGLNWFIF